MNVISLKAVLQISYKDSLHGPSGLAWIKRYLAQLLLVEVGSMTACIHSAIRNPHEQQFLNICILQYCFLNMTSVNIV